MTEPILHGFDGSTYVRTVKIVLNRKGVAHEQNPVDVLAGETRGAAHLERHPFGTVPVLDIDGIRIRETDAILRYLEATRDGPAAIPESARDRARMDEALSMIHAHGYDALVGVAFYHLKPDFIGSPTEEAHRQTLDTARRFMEHMGEIRGGDPWLAGAGPSLADYCLGPLIFYVGLTPHLDEVLAAGDLSDWWERTKRDEAFAATEPDLDRAPPDQPTMR